MRVLVAILALLTLAAGCVTPGGSVETSSAPQDLAAIVGPQGVLHGPNATAILAPAGFVRALGGMYKTGIGAVEPTVGVDKDGTLFMTGIAPGPTGRAAPTIMRSDDKGMTWTSVGAPAHVATFDPYVYVDPATGRVFQDDILPIGCGMTSFSDDKGASWTTNPLGCGNPQVNDHQTLVAAKPRQLQTAGYPNLVYRCVNNVAYSACAVSVNGGLSFLPQVPIPGTLGVDASYDVPIAGPVSGPVCSALTGHLRAAPDGTVYLPTTDCTTTASPPVVASTKDDGLTWSVEVVSKDHKSDDHDSPLAVDEEGNLYIVWPGVDGHMWLARRGAQDKAWSEPIDVTAPGVTAVAFPAISAGAPGRVAIAYIGTDVADGYEGKESADDWKGAAWNAYVTVVTGALSDSPVLQSATANDPADPVARGQCGRTRCSGMTDFIDMVIDAEGRPWASFVDVCNDDCVTGGADAKNAGNQGFVATLRAGPALRGALAALPELALQGVS